MAIIQLSCINNCMRYIYKIHNLTNGKWYIGKHSGNDPAYMGSGKILKLAIKKYGIENFKKEILEECETEDTLNEREKWWIASTNAINDPTSYNLVEGGTGGDRSQFIPYEKMDRSNQKCVGPRVWWESLTDEERKDVHRKQGEARGKGWYVSKVDDKTEIFVKNIAKWCEAHGIDKSMPTMLTNASHPLFQKQTKGWRIRRFDMPTLPTYIDKRNIGHDNVACKGKTWKLVDGKRVWSHK